MSPGFMIHEAKKQPFRRYTLRVLSVITVEINSLCMTANTDYQIISISASLPTLHFFSLSLFLSS